MRPLAWPQVFGIMALCAVMAMGAMVWLVVLSWQLGHMVPQHDTGLNTVIAVSLLVLALSVAGFVVPLAVKLVSLWRTRAA